jgi:hypothetical protein
MYLYTYTHGLHNFQYSNNSFPPNGTECALFSYTFLYPPYWKETKDINMCSSAVANCSYRLSCMPVNRVKNIMVVSESEE